jgi:hypothetical protein
LHAHHTSTSEFSQLREIAIQTALLQHNWSSPKPKVKAVKTVSIGRGERMVGLVPGAELFLTESARQTGFQIYCRDISMDRPLSDPSSNSIPTHDAVVGEIFWSQLYPHYPFSNYSVRDSGEYIQAVIVSGLYATNRFASPTL